MFVTSDAEQQQTLQGTLSKGAKAPLMVFLGSFIHHHCHSSSGSARTTCMLSTCFIGFSYVCLLARNGVLNLRPHVCTRLHRMVTLWHPSCMKRSIFSRHACTGVEVDHLVSAALMNERADRQ